MKICLQWVLLFVLLGGSLLTGVSVSPVLGQSETITIFFYSSETNINNFKSLKMEFDSYLAQFGAYEFQPFSNKSTFEEQIQQKQNCLILLSSWHYDNIRELYQLRPILVGARKGKTSQKRLLVSSGITGDLETVKTGQIASASSVQYTQKLLSEMFQPSEAATALKILTVPKDIDALMSLGFGMAKAAITTDYSLNTLKMMNPVLHKKLSVLAESKESRLLILAAPEACEKLAQQLVSIFQNMADDQQGRKKLRMLGLDAWKALGDSDSGN